MALREINIPRIFRVPDSRAVVIFDNSTGKLSGIEESKLADVDISKIPSVSQSYMADLIPRIAEAYGFRTLDDVQSGAPRITAQDIKSALIDQSITTLRVEQSQDNPHGVTIYKDNQMVQKSPSLADIRAGVNASPGAMQSNVQSSIQPARMLMQPPISNLQEGQSGDEVKKLQNWLISQGYDIPAGATGFYGKQTKAAVEAWQRANGVEGGQNFGFWGPKSREVALSTFQHETPATGAIKWQYEPSGASLGAVGAVNDPVQQKLAGLPPQFQELYKTLSQYLQQLQARGKNINPNIDITADKLAEFLRQAENEIDPYYKTQLKLARESFLRSVGYGKDELLRKEQELERQYGKELRNIGESAAEKGFALSGGRQTAERELAEGTQREIEAGRRQLGFQAGTGARQFAQAYGQPDFNPQITGAPRVLAGQERFQTGTEQGGLYDLDPSVYEGLVGEQEFARRGATQQRASQLEQAFRENQAIQQQRSLVL